MTPVSTNFSSLLGQLSSLTPGSEISGNGNLLSSGFSSIFEAENYYKSLKSGDSTEKANAIQGIVQTIISLVDQITSANQDVENNKRATKKLNKSIDNTREKISKELGNLEKSAAEQVGIITKETDNIEGFEKELKEQQDELNKVIEEINEKQAKLAGETDPKEQAKLLGEIQTLSGQLSPIIASITSLNDKINKSVEIAVEAQSEMKPLQEEQEQILAEGEQEIISDVQDATEDATETTETMVTGTENLAEAATLQTAAGATAATVVGAPAAAELEKKAVELTQAGTTRTTGALSNIADLRTSILGLSDNANLLTQLNENVVGAVNTFNNLFGAWKGTIDPVIKSIGSLVGESGIAAQKQELDSYVTADLNKIESSGNTNTQNTGNTEGISDIKNQNNISGLQTPEAKIRTFGI